MSPKEIVEKYYESLGQKTDVWQELYADDTVFSDASGTLHAEGKDAVIQSFTRFLQGVSGLQVKQLIEENGHVCAVVNYEYVNQKGEKLSQDDAEVWEVTNGKLHSLTIYFDLTAYRTFMRG